ncbi:B12-binding domain-containing protein [Dactylosporangium siamense]|uniref:Cobalamin-binding protein n=1 Tax=Dactylosporangium siamense TaxID=685454 RepID=A0A919PM06_9ACTN|nr:cobalamin-dependent protein [Dactylosporangium siamense]GIG46597.1 cobalamin-binding protein [Dactylosporangium siamense]
MTGLAFWPYFDLLQRRDAAGAVQYALALVDGGADPVDVLLDVVAPAQEQVGLRWAEGAWTVAHEHAATATSESVAIAVGARIPAPATPVGHVILACAEREWHGLPARLVGYGLQAAGWRTTFLGASTSPLQFARFLDDVDADAVAISCSVAASLPAARRLIGAAREAGLPVLVGGGAFGPDDTRARALGASGWAGDARTAATVLTGLVAAASDLTWTVDRARHAGADEHAEMVIRFAEFRAAARRHWLDAPGDPADEAGLARDAVDHALHSLSAALLTDDPRLLREADDWLTALFAARGEPATSVPSLWRSLHRTVGEPLPEAARHLKAL